MRKKGKWNGERKGPPFGIRNWHHPVSVREVLPGNRLGPNLITNSHFDTDDGWSEPCNYGER